MGKRSTKGIKVKSGSEADKAFKKFYRKALILTVSFCLLVGGIFTIAIVLESQKPAFQLSDAAPQPVTDSSPSASTTPAPATAPLPDKTFDEKTKDAYTPAPVATPISLKPSTLNIPSLGISASVVTGGEQDGNMVLPESSKVALYSGAAALTSDKGSTVIAGHVNFADGSAGALGPLYRIVKGAPIYASDAAGKVHTYKVTKLEILDKKALPDDIFRTSGDKQLVVVTCGGDIEKVNGVLAYTHNLVVTAEPA